MNELKDTAGPSHSTPRPSVGRIVHYVLHASANLTGQHRAAIIVDVYGDFVTLDVFLACPCDIHRIARLQDQLLSRHSEIVQDESTKAPGPGIGRSESKVCRQRSP